jgi:hypothetical protein
MGKRAKVSKNDAAAGVIVTIALFSIIRYLVIRRQERRLAAEREAGVELGDARPVKTIRVDGAAPAQVYRKGRPGQPHKTEEGGSGLVQVQGRQGQRNGGLRRLAPSPIESETDDILSLYMNGRAYPYVSHQSNKLSLPHFCAR